MSADVPMAYAEVDTIQFTDLDSGDADGWIASASISVEMEIGDDPVSLLRRRALFTVRLTDPPESLVVWVGKYFRPLAAWGIRGWTPRRVPEPGVPERAVMAIPRIEALGVSTHPRIDTPEGLEGPPVGRVELLITGEVPCRVGRAAWAVDHDDAALDARLG